MRVEAGLFREPGERTLPRDLLVPVARTRGRPRAEYRPRVRTAQDVETLLELGVPARLVTSEWVTDRGYPVQFRPWLAVPEGLSGKIATEFRLLPVRDPDLLRAPGVEELVTLLLRFDPLAARVVARRNRAALDRWELYRRVRNEGLERAATRVRLQELAPAIPAVGEALPREELRWLEKNNPSGEPAQ